MGKIKVREIYKLKEKGILITQGIALGDKIATGKHGYSIVPGGNQLLEGKFLLPI
jgi:pyruvate,water dikinase